MNSVLRTILSILLLAMATTTQLVSASPAAADVTTLCKGYTGCAQQGMSDAGYGRSSGAMYWRMYPGNNCTNYVAFRMIQNGMPNVRPWDGGGNATYWGTSMASITDNVPTVGSVAWWKAGVYPAGSAGHVAYVERVVDADTIIVSQDFWGGDFSWARITRGNRGWPNGFIHFNDASLTNLTRPTLSGAAQVGATLTATAGTWTPAADVSYQWRAAGADIPGATSPTFSVGADQVGQRVRVRVTATKPGYSTAVASSPRSSRIVPGTMASVTAPRIDGEAVVDGTLTALAGSWNPSADGATLQWLADGAPIAGAVTRKLTPGAALVGSRLSVRVTASRRGFTDVTVTSPATAPVAAAVLAPATEPALSGVPRLGEVLQLAPGTTAPSASPSIEWLRNGRVVPAASGSSYALGPDDLGTRISARIQWDRPGYVPVQDRSTRTTLVKAAPALGVRLRAGVNRLRVRVDAPSPPGVALPDHVRLRTGGTTTSLPLVEGRATVVLTELAPGTTPVKVVLPGTRTTARAIVIEEVAIL